MKLERLPSSPLPPAPVTPARPHDFEIHGTTIRDDYAWLKAENWKEVLKDPSALDASIRSALEQENAYAAAAFAGTEDFQARLVAEMRGRIKEDDSTVPQPHGPFAYFTRYREGGQHPLVCRQPREGGPETIMLDGDKEAEGHPFFDLGGADHSPDHRLMAWGSDLKGSEYFTIRVRDLESGADLPDEVPPPASPQASTDALDALLAEIDGNLQVNAEQFVRSFVQKGGQ